MGLFVFVQRSLVPTPGLCLIKVFVGRGSVGVDERTARGRARDCWLEMVASDEGLRDEQ